MISPNCTQDIPLGIEISHITQDIPHGTEYPHDTAHTLYRVVITVLPWKSSLYLLWVTLSQPKSKSRRSFERILWFITLISSSHKLITICVLLHFKHKNDVTISIKLHRAEGPEGWGEQRRGLRMKALMRDQGTRLECRYSIYPPTFIMNPPRY